MGVFFILAHLSIGRINFYFADLFGETDKRTHISKEACVPLVKLPADSVLLIPPEGFLLVT